MVSVATTALLSISALALLANGKSLPKAGVRSVGHGSRVGADLVEDAFSLLEDPIESDEIELADWLKVEEEGPSKPLSDAPLRSEILGGLDNKLARKDAASVSQDTVWFSKMVLRALILVVVGLGVERYNKEKPASQPSVSVVKVQATKEESQLDAYGCTALHRAVHEGRMADVAALLKHGDSVNDLDDWDETPLHFAARRGDVSMCKLLVSEGADIEAVNANGETPLLVAGLAKQEATSEFLLDAGATVGDVSADELPGTLNVLLFCRLLESK